MSWAKSCRTAAAIFLPAQPRQQAGPCAAEKKTSVVLQRAAEGTRRAIESRLYGPERRVREPELAPPTGLSDTKLPPRPLERPGSHSPTWDWLEDLKAGTWCNLSKGPARQNYSVFRQFQARIRSPRLQVLSETTCSKEWAVFSFYLQFASPTLKKKKKKPSPPTHTRRERERMRENLPGRYIP